jgi:hypothetical protein
MTKNNKKPTGKIETITVAKAKKFLASMPDNQRAVRATHVTKLADMLTEGLWQCNGDAIRINTNGEMFDGQHRCLAVVQTGIPIDTFVVRGLAVETFATVDCNTAPRKLRDQLSSRFPDLKKQSDLIAQIYGKVLDYEGTTPDGYQSMGHRNRGTWNYEKAFEWVETDKKHLLKILEVIKSKEAKVTCQPQAIFGAMYYLFRKTSIKEADAFFETMIDGLNYPLGKEDPIYWCNKEIAALHAKRGKGVWPKRFNFYAALDYAWQAYMTGTRITSAKQLRVQKSKGFIKFSPKLKRRRLAE